MIPCLHTSDHYMQLIPGLHDCIQSLDCPDMHPQASIWTDFCHVPGILSCCIVFAFDFVYIHVGS